MAVTPPAKPSHNEWTGTFDGKGYLVTGDPTTDMRSVKLVKAGHDAIINKKDGKAMLDDTVDFSADFKTRTLITHITARAPPFSPAPR